MFQDDMRALARGSTREARVLGLTGESAGNGGVSNQVALAKVQRLGIWRRARRGSERKRERERGRKVPSVSRAAYLFLAKHNAHVCQCASASASANANVHMPTPRECREVVKCLLAWMMAATRRPDTRP